MFTPLLILRNPDYHVALMVDHVSEIVSVTDDAVVSIREDHTFNDCAKGVVTVRDRLVLVLSAERILLEKEGQSLAEFETIEQGRLRALEQTGPWAPSRLPHTR
jgi:chemotaxis signal transduction protein